MKITNDAKVRLRRGDIIAVHVLGKGHSCYRFPRPFCIGGYIAKTPQRWRADGSWAAGTEQHPNDIVAVLEP